MHGSVVRSRRAVEGETTWLRTFVVLGALVLATVAAGHELTYLFAYGSGYDAAMEASGHAGYWTSFVVTVGVAIGGLVVVALRQFARLRAQLRDVEGIADASPWMLLAMWLRSAAAIGPAALLVYVVQENVETATVTGAFPGLTVLAGDHVVAAPVIVLIAAFAAFVYALVRWRRDVLERRLRAARRRVFPTSSLAPSRAGSAVAPRHRYASPVHGRAPPLTPAPI